MSTWFGLDITYRKASWRVTIQVDESYQNQLEGLCGNFNGNSTDDLIGKAGNLITDVGTFGSEWVVPWVGPGKPGVCENIAEPQKECTDSTIIETCLMLNSSQIFSECQNVMASNDIDFLVENCISDLCADTNLKCSIFDNFAQSCMETLHKKQKSPSKICKWADETGCTPKCGSNAHFEACADTCSDTRTCGHLEASQCPSFSKKSSMCVCDHGYLLQGNNVQVHAIKKLNYLLILTHLNF